ncbi:MAG TPA: ASCH domain-containing protein [Microlunatus sp.]|nr:ASCH domain-containing protein [Microlunatus sp.]
MAGRGGAADRHAWPESSLAGERPGELDRIARRLSATPPCAVVVAAAAALASSVRRTTTSGGGGETTTPTKGATAAKARVVVVTTAPASSDTITTTAQPTTPFVGALDSLRIRTRIALIGSMPALPHAGIVLSSTLTRVRELTITQPWPELIITGLKDVENRSRRTNFRGRLAVHAGQQRAEFADLDLGAMPQRFRRPIEDAWQRHDNAGKVLGTVELVDCVQDSPSVWAMDGYWHWILRDPRPYARPVPAKGQLGIWEWRR